MIINEIERQNFRKNKEKRYMWLQPKVKDISNQYVDEGIGDDYKEWNCNTCVIISTPTGSGKNTFIMDKLIPQSSGLMEIIYG